MKKQLHIFILFLTLGFFLLPAMTYACGTKSEKECCKKEASSKSEKKECNQDNHSKDNNNTCGGKCGHSNCTTSSVNFSILSFFEMDLKDNNFDFSLEKSKFHDSKTFISSGFTSVWLPPKIK